MSVSLTNVKTAFQEQIPHNHCFGCGPLNTGGLQIKSYWLDDAAETFNSYCEFVPQLTHCAGPTTVVNGGIISTVMDCHAICSAMAEAYRREGLNMDGSIWYATASLQVSFLAAAPLSQRLRCVAQLQVSSARKTLIDCEVWAGDVLCAKGHVIAVRVAADWATTSNS
ncbi:MAG: PaaI family thioesterase [Gammaproteobacteria bacterium]|nr:PaaI family thioesterase [Gammaproteobacteria bacterium]